MYVFVHVVYSLALGESLLEQCLHSYKQPCGAVVEALGVSTEGTSLNAISSQHSQDST